MALARAVSLLVALAVGVAADSVRLSDVDRARIVKEADAEVEAIRSKAAAERRARYEINDGLQLEVEGDNEGRVTEEMRRSLMEEANHMSHKMHYPLSCNEGIEATDCTPFSQLLTTYLESSADTPLTVPCGTCSMVDVTDSSLLLLPHGLRIEGKLLFPSESSVTLRTTFVLVLGLLNIETPNHGNKVTFSLYGEDDVYFHPHPENSMACNINTGCNIGSKVIAVAGGKVDIRGMQEECPAWEKLLDVGRMASVVPSMSPSMLPSLSPSLRPSGVPTPYPTVSPSVSPTHSPSSSPTSLPTSSPTPKPTDSQADICTTNLIPNGSIMGGTISPFQANKSRRDIAAVDCDETQDCVLRFKGYHWFEGPTIDISPDCFLSKPDAQWKASFDVRLYDDATGDSVACDGSILYCPWLRIWSYDKNGKKRIDNIFGTHLGGWSTGAPGGEVPWNHFETNIEVRDYWINAIRIRLDFVGAPDSWTIAELDNLVFAAESTQTPPPPPTKVPTTSPVRTFDCERDDLVTNGDISDWTYDPFRSPRHGIDLSLVECTNQGDCSLQTDKELWFDGPVIEIPATECLQTVGSKWWLRFDVKMVDTATGDVLACAGGHLCPMVRIWFHKADGGRDIENVLPSPWAGGWDMDGGYNRFDAVVEVKDSWTDATKIELHLDGGPDGLHSTIVDNLSLVPFSECNGNLAINGAFDRGFYAPFVPPRAGVDLDLVYCDAREMDCSLQTTKPYWHDGPRQEINHRCFTDVGQKWFISYDVKLSDADSNALPCTGSAFECPMVRLFVWDSNGALEIENIYTDWTNWQTDDGSGTVPWNHFEATFDVENYMIDATKVELHIVGGPNDGMTHKSVIDNVVFEAVPVTTSPTASPIEVPVSIDCSVDLIANGQVGFNSYIPFVPVRNGLYPSVVDCASSGDCSLKTDNDYWHDGVKQTIPPRCFVHPEQEFTISYDVKLIDKATGDPLSCTGNIRCPMLRIQTDGGDIDDYYQDDWSGWTTEPGAWNHFEVNITTKEAYIGAQTVELMFVGGPDLPYYRIIDNVRVIPGPIPPPPEPPLLTPDQIYVTPSAAECWGPGSELVITTNTHFSADYQQVTVHSSDPSTGVVTLTEGLTYDFENPLSTMANDPRQAVEVALLDRRVLFEADDASDNDEIGGHLIFYHTPDVTQHLEGVEIRNFGQAGRLGRYPVHFHLCESTPSLVKKTVVRQSNQRCYVIHGSQNITLEENISFDTFGHCFMNEDGSEHSNSFIRNLGIHTKKATTLIDSERGETDDSAGTFWMVNMENSFVGNVMAGSEHYGFFIEGHRKIRGPSLYQDPDLNPMRTTPSIFKDNTIHGHKAFGMTTYPRGWNPPSQAMLENLSVYRGQTTGMFIHNSGNIKFQGGYFLNHRKIAIEMDGADELTVNGTIIVDRTSSDRNMGCGGSNRRGIVVHPVKQDRMNTTIFGTTLINVDMLEFGKERCEDWQSLPLQLGDSFMIDKPVFDIPTLFYNVSIDMAGQPQDLNPLIAIDGCNSATETNVTDIAIEVANDAQGVFSSSTGGFIVSPSIASLLDPAACLDIQGCLKYCQGACLRTILFHTDVTYDSVMTVKDINHPERTYTFKSADFMGDTFAYTSAYFGASLSTSDYEVSFHDASTNELIFPSFVAPIFLNAPSSCDTYANESTVNIVKPSSSRVECDDLIRSGSFDTENSIVNFLEISTSSSWLAAGGIGETGALTYEHRSTNSGVNQYLDLSCLVEGDVWQFEASYRVVNSTTGLNLDQSSCHSGMEVYCIHSWIEFRENDNSQLGDTVHSMRQTLGRAVAPLLIEGSSNFGRISGTWTVTSSQASSRANRALMHINNVRSGGQVILDSISLTREVPST